MNTLNRNFVFILLSLSAFLLASLIPGGPVENRDFSHINLAVLSGFNLFLTVLNLGSFTLLYFVYRNRRWAFSLAWFAALAYFVVYAIDLAQIFPRSPTAMSQALAMVEVLGMCVAVPLMFICWPYTIIARWLNAEAYRQLFAEEEPAGRATLPVLALQALLVVVIFLVGIGIIDFATNSALQSASMPAALFDGIAQQAYIEFHGHNVF